MTDDWLASAAASARERITRSIQPKFKKKQWAEFDQRLTEGFDSLFRHLHRLYGWQYDFAWTVESLVEVAAGAYLERSKRQHKLDRSGSWQGKLDQASTWALTYVDHLDADLEGLTDHVRYLTGLGVTHLHLRGQAPVDKLNGVIEVIDEAGISLALDFALSHTPFDHKWAHAASAGEGREDYYFLYPDRSIPDLYAPSLRENRSDREGDSFTWHPDIQGGRWVWTTFQPTEWDLNYSNPQVLVAMAGEMLEVANLGVWGIRLESPNHLWKSPGTSCEDLPEAHVIVQILRLLADLAAPSFTFITDTDSFVHEAECHVGYHSLMMSSIWEAIATTDTRLLGIALGERLQRRTECWWLNCLRDGGQLGWEFHDGDAIRHGIDPVLHRRYLNRFYTGQEPGSFARGSLFPPDAEPDVAQIAGSLASLAGLEAATENMDPTATELAVRRVLAAWAVVVAAEGIPLFLLGDEIATLNDHSYRSDPRFAGDLRWMHRPPLDRSRVERALLGPGPEAEVLAGIRNLLAARWALERVDPVTPVELIDPGAPGVLVFQRGRSLLAANLTDHIALITRDSFPEGDYVDLISQEVWDAHVLGPYEHRFVRL